MRGIPQVASRLIRPAVGPYDLPRPSYRGGGVRLARSSLLDRSSSTCSIGRAQHDPYAALALSNRVTSRIRNWGGAVSYERGTPVRPRPSTLTPPRPPASFDLLDVAQATEGCLNPSTISVCPVSDHLTSVAPCAADHSGHDRQKCLNLASRSGAPASRTWPHATSMSPPSHTLVPEWIPKTPDPSTRVRLWNTSHPTSRN